MIISKNDRDNYGIIYSSDDLVNNMLNMIPEKYYKNKNIRWLDIGTGTGQFTSKIIERLLIHLSYEFNSKNECYEHIITKMIWMNEIYNPHIVVLKEKFGNNANIICKDFLTLNIYEYDKFDIVLGNPPFQINGCIKTPAHKKINKKNDGKSIYVEFTKKAFDVVYESGLVCLIIPALWLKPDKAGLYYFLTNKNILKLNCISTLESSKIFNNKAQVACTYFLIENTEKIKDKINIFDNMQNNYIDFYLKDNNAIPTNYISIINKLSICVNKVGNIKYSKTNIPSNKFIFKENKEDEYIYKNIKTCYFENNEPKLVIVYSNLKTKYIDGIPKIILSHKRLGIPFLDINGEYGISTRDNYIISGNDYTIEELVEIQYFLSCKFILFIYMCFNYRMSFLERYVFNYIPLIIKITNFPKLSKILKDNRDDEIMNFFGLTENEKNYIKKYIKDYKFFI